MIKKLLVPTPAALMVCALAVSPVFAETVIIKKDHYHHDMHRYHHPDKKVIVRH